MRTSGRPFGLSGRIQTAEPYARSTDPSGCDAVLQNQPYSCQGKSMPGKSGPTYHIPQGCGIKDKYPAYILGKVTPAGLASPTSDLTPTLT